jgi:hypothetical protein
LCFLLKNKYPPFIKINKTSLPLLIQLQQTSNNNG